MKKRTLIVLAILVLLSLAAFAACDDHTHEYSPKSDGVNHWKECICGDKIDVEAHVLTWVTTDATNHWQKCDCGYTTTPAAHAEGSNADGKCDACGKDLHEHAYTWQSDAVSHWQVCACGDTTTPASHVDVKNNETQADGADGKCDACAHEIYAVTFNMQGHGEAIAVQNIGKGGKATAPATPADDDAWKFDGWYKEAACENVFNFAEEVINEATTVYAKWTEDTRDGASKAHAYALTLGTEKYVAIQKDQLVYLVYTASLEGRYTISLGSGVISQKCTFTADKAEGTYDGTHSLTLDLAAGAKVYIAITCAEELDEEAAAEILIKEVTDETLPEGYFLAGEYFGIDSAYSLEIVSRDAGNQKLSFNETDYTFKYVGGSLDRIYFTDSSTSITTVYYLEHHADGTYTLCNRENNGNKSTLGTLEYYVAQDPVALSQLAGYYVPKNYNPGSDDDNPDNPGIERAEGSSSGITNNILGLYIYLSDNENATSVRYLYKDSKNDLGYSELIDANYNIDKNRLTFGQYIVTLNLANDGSVESIKIGANVYVYESAAGEIPASQLPLIADEEYRGETHTIRTTFGSQLFGAEGHSGITVMEGNDTNGIYTIKVALGKSFDTYKVKVLNDGEIVELYAEDGETKIDTLTKYVYTFTYKDLATDGTVNSLVLGDFYKQVTYLKVTEGGWYTFTDISESLMLYANVYEFDLDYYEFCDLVYSGVAINLEEGTIVVAACTSVGEGVSFKSQKGEAPIGMAEDNPFVWEEGFELQNVNNKDYYYVKYTATEAGTYAISAYYLFDNGESIVRNYTCYTIDEESYGYSWYMWIGGTSEEEPYAVIALDADQSIIIRINREGDSNELADAVVVEIAEYVPVVKEEIFTEDEAGTYFVENVEDPIFSDIITVTLTFDRYGKGVYYQGFYEYDIKVSKNDDGSYEFAYGEEGDTVTFSIVNGNLEIEDSYLGELTLEKGESEEPEEPDVPDGIVYIGELEGGNPAALVISGDKVTYTVNGAIDVQNAQLQKDGDTYTFSNNFGDTHTFTISEDGNTIEFTDGWLNVSGTLIKQA